MSLTDQITKVDFFKRKTDAAKWDWDTGTFVGRPFKMHYDQALVLVADAWKERAHGIPQGCFLLAYYDCDPAAPSLQEAILLRVIEPAELPTDRDMVSSMVEYYKDFIRTGDNQQSQLDQYSRYEFGFSGVRCAILGCFYSDTNGKLRFGADLENFYSAHNYSVIKPTEDILKMIVNYRDSGVPGGTCDIRIGRVRYSSSQRFAVQQDVPVYVKTTDFAGKRSGLFGMTRTGKSNSIKKIIQANEQMSSLATLVLDKDSESAEEILRPIGSDGAPKYPIGQIVFDMNGEYANANLQDAGTAIFDIYKDKTDRYSIVPKQGFKVLKVNFYREISSGFELIRSFPSIEDDQSRFISAFRSVDLERPKNYDIDFGARARYERKIAAYCCVLHKAGFVAPDGYKVRFSANKEIRGVVDPDVDPSAGLGLDEAADWFEGLWAIHKENNGFKKAKKSKAKGADLPAEIIDEQDQDDQKEWADDDLKALLVMLTKCRTSGGGQDCSGYLTLREIVPQHTAQVQTPFEQDILSALRKGRIVIVDLSSGEESLQKMYSERITRYIFRDGMRRFTEARPNNFIQFYFEEAHNLFPKKEDKDLSQIYNRLAKEGAKLHLGLVYATQELSSISGNILKNTQNWFVSHLNNEDEIRELRKYYDFSDFGESLMRFSQDTDKGFVRVKTYSNAFVVPVQIDKFAGHSSQGAGK